MVTVTVTYPRQEGATFDYDYYVKTHLPLVSEIWGGQGLVRVGALRGVAAAGGGDPPYLAMALIEFESMEALQEAMADEAAARLGADLANFSSVAPVIQVNEPLA